MDVIMENAETPQVRKPRRSAEAIALEKKDEYKFANDRAKAVKKKTRTRKNIVLGANLDSFAENNNAICQQALEIIKNSLTRDDDRKLFDLPPLPKPVVAAPSTKPSTSELLARFDKPGPPSGVELAARLDKVVAAKRVFEMSPREPSDLSRYVVAVLAYESVSGEIWRDLTDRVAAGLSPIAGKRLGSS